jgi:hypothetical protein
VQSYGGFTAGGNGGFRITFSGGEKDERQEKISTESVNAGYDFMQGSILE